jgi:PAS domain S-box-containing protein
MEYTHQELMNFFNAMDDVFFSVDRLNSRMIQISQSCVKLYGYSVADFLDNYLLWFDLVHPDDQPIAAAETATLMRGEQVNSQYRIIRKDKAIRWIEKTVIPGLDEAGNLLRVDGIVRDITERKLAEEKLSQSEARYRQIVETAQEGIWTIDEHNKTNFVNKKICEILGYAPEEMLGKELYDFMDAPGKAYAIACMERRRGGAKENLDIRYVTKQGTDVWANISANPIFDEHGVYKGSLAMVTDITQRKLDEDASKMSEANLRTIFNNTDASYVLCNEDLNIISFNALAQTYSEEHNKKSLEVNRSIKDYFAPERWPFVEELLERVAREGSVDYELSFANSDGTSKWHHIRWLIVRNSENLTRGFILANTDITAAKLAELEREKITSDLIQHNKDLEQFTYIISHNLRAPIANILGLADILTASNTSEDKEEIFDKVATSVKTLDLVIHDLNHILQVRKPMDAKKETVYFEKLVSDIKVSILNTATKEHIRIDCDFAEVDSLYTMRSYLYSIFYNLLSNAIKFRRPGVEAVISIKSQRLGDKTELRFKDNGKGIDMDKNKQNLFGLYKRFDTSTEGKGMGLFMVKTQIEALGGTVSVNSELGQGTEFVMQFAS